MSAFQHFKARLQLLWRQLNAIQRRKIKFFLLFCTLSLLVITWPQLFYFQENSYFLTRFFASLPLFANNSVKTELSSALSTFRSESAAELSEVQQLIELIESEQALTRAKISEIQSRQSFFRESSEADRLSLQQHSEDALRQQQVLTKSKQAESLIGSRSRAISPIFTAPAFNEARSLWLKSQLNSVHQSVKVWKWNLMIEGVLGLFGVGHQSRDAVDYVMYTVGSLFFNMAFGVVVGNIDFIFRLPFYIKQYERWDFSQVESVEELGSLFPSLRQQERLDALATEHDINSDKTQTHPQQPKLQQSSTTPTQQPITGTNTAKPSISVSTSASQRLHSGSTHSSLDMYSDSFYQHWARRVDALNREAEQFNAHHFKDLIGLQSSGFSSSVRAVLFWLLCVGAAALAGVALCALIWSPVVLCVFGSLYLKTRAHYQTQTAAFSTTTYRYHQD